MSGPFARACRHSSLRLDRRPGRVLTRRVCLALLAGALASLYVSGSGYLWAGYSTDFDQLWIGARALLDGHEPYTTVRALNTRHDVVWGLLYPMPAVLLGACVAWLPLTAARALVAAIAAFCLALLVSRDRGKWPILLSGAMRSSVSLVQLTPFLACATLVPWFGWALAMKPNAAVAVWSSVRNRKALAISAGVAAAVITASLLVDPAWPIRWRDAITGPHFLRPLVMRPFGAVLLLAALKWRRPEARWLFVTALIPSTANVYEALPLLTVMALSFREALVLSILSHLADIGAYALRADASYAALANANAMTMLWLFYIPVLFLILRRPNEPVALSHPASNRRYRRWPPGIPGGRTLWQ